MPERCYAPNVLHYPAYVSDWITKPEIDSCSSNLVSHRAIDPDRTSTNRKLNPETTRLDELQQEWASSNRSITKQSPAGLVSVRRRKIELDRL